MPTTRLEWHEDLPPDLRAAARALVEAASADEGHGVLGEHKHTQLTGTAAGWSAAVARHADGRLAGYAHVLWNDDGSEEAAPPTPRASVEVALDPALDPAGRDRVGGTLLEAVEQAVARRGGGHLWAWSRHVTDPGATLPAARGYRVQRRLAFMRRPLADRPDSGPPPRGVLVRGYAGASDDEEFLRVNNDAFAGHPENGGWTPEVFAARRRLGWFDPQGLLLAWRGDRLLGFHWTKRHGGGTGEVYVLAVHPEAQGTGLGRHLLAAGLAHLHDRGCREVVLYVDRATPGAVALYEAAGFEAVHDDVCQELLVTP